MPHGSCHQRCGEKTKWKEIKAVIMQRRRGGCAVGDGHVCGAGILCVWLACRWMLRQWWWRHTIIWSVQPAHGRLVDVRLVPLGPGLWWWKPQQIVSVPPKHWNWSLSNSVFHSYLLCSRVFWGKLAFVPRWAVQTGSGWGVISLSLSRSRSRSRSHRLRKHLRYLEKHLIQ